MKNIQQHIEVALRNLVSIIYSDLSDSFCEPYAGDWDQEIKAVAAAIMELTELPATPAPD